MTMTDDEIARLRELILRPPTEIPNIKTGDYGVYIVLLKLANGTILSREAAYLEYMPLKMEDDDGCGECPDDGSHDDGCPQTGWHEIESRYDDEFFIPLLRPGDELIGWIPRPSLASLAAVPALLAERDALKGQVEGLREKLAEARRINVDAHAAASSERFAADMDELRRSLEEFNASARSALAAAGAKGGPDA